MTCRRFGFVYLFKLRILHNQMMDWSRTVIYWRPLVCEASLQHLLVCKCICLSIVYLSCVATASSFLCWICILAHVGWDTTSVRLRSGCLVRKKPGTLACRDKPFWLVSALGLLMTEWNWFGLTTILYNVLNICWHVEKVRHQGRPFVTTGWLNLIDTYIEILSLLHCWMILKYLVRVVSIALHRTKTKRSHHHAVSISLSKLLRLDSAHGLIKLTWMGALIDSLRAILAIATSLMSTDLDMCEVRLLSVAACAASEILTSEASNLIRLLTFELVRPLALMSWLNSFWTVSSISVLYASHVVLIHFATS